MFSYGQDAPVHTNPRVVFFGFRVSVILWVTSLDDCLELRAWVKRLSTVECIGIPRS